MEVPLKQNEFGFLIPVCFEWKRQLEPGCSWFHSPDTLDGNFFVSIIVIANSKKTKKKEFSKKKVCML